MRHPKITMVRYVQPIGRLMISHTRTVVRECCKGDNASQCRNPKFDPPPRSNPKSDSHKSWQRWLRRGPPTPVQKFVTIRTGVSFLRMRDFAHQKRVSFFWVLATRYSPGPWTDFDAKYAKTCGSAQGCAFSRSRTQNLTFRPPFPQISAILGTIFDGTKFSPKNRLTMGMLPLEHLLIVIVDA